MAAKYGDMMTKLAADRPPHQSTLDILRTLVAFPSVSRDPNRDLIDWVVGYLEQHGISSRLTQGDHPGKANLFATIGSGEGGIVLSGHTDVVPVDGQKWASDPFAIEEREGLLYGRGTCDMKGFIAVVLSRLPNLIAAKRKEPVHIALSFDEEIGCKGVHHLLDDLVAQGIKPRACIVGEPTSMRAVAGHKAGSVFLCTLNGREAHSSLAPQGVNTIEYAAQLIVKIKSIADRLKAEETRHEGYEVPYSTLQTGVIQAGFAANIVPALCTFRFDVRTLPWTNALDLVDEIRAYANDELLPEMRGVAPEAAIEIVQHGNVPGFAIDADAPLVRYVQRLAGSNEPPAFVTFGSEAGLFQAQDIPTVICGPGSISQAHKPDEYVALSQLALCEDFIDRLAETDLP